jgi:phage replication-related protein YjqB (UPF0714/DUF867 family)
MPDRYASYRELVGVERAGIDFVIRRAVGKTPSTLILSPHAGRIEPGISEIILAIARDDLSYYLFEGIKPHDNSVLHITSPNFDEPGCLSLVQTSTYILAIHGEHGDDQIVYMGGLAGRLRRHLKSALLKQNFVAKEHAKPALQGTSPENICNRGKSGAGVQLELSRGLRKSFFDTLDGEGPKKPTARLYAFAEAVRNGLRAAGAL